MFDPLGGGIAVSAEDEKLLTVIFVWEAAVVVGQVFGGDGGSMEGGWV